MLYNNSLTCHLAIGLTILFETRRYSLTENSGQYEINSISSNRPSFGSSRPSNSQYVMEQDPMEQDPMEQDSNEYIELRQVHTHSTGRFADLDTSGSSEPNYYNFIINI